MAIHKNFFYVTFLTWTLHWAIGPAILAIDLVDLQWEKQTQNAYGSYRSLRVDWHHRTALSLSLGLEAFFPENHDQSRFFEGLLQWRDPSNWFVGLEGGSALKRSPFHANEKKGLWIGHQFAGWNLAFGGLEESYGTDEPTTSIEIHRIKSEVYVSPIGSSLEIKSIKQRPTEAKGWGYAWSLGMFETTREIAVSALGSRLKDPLANESFYREYSIALRQSVILPYWLLSQVTWIFPSPGDSYRQVQIGLRAQL